ncbi:serine/threonine-protein kinase PAK 3-like [Passer domesticus]|uniref:serine/threonine-protein kinase PAK 3-like n=1 Tax=Passer domesticus TaxID=48849 RepID=UPI0030FEEBCE
MKGPKVGVRHRNCPHQKCDRFRTPWALALDLLPQQHFLEEDILLNLGSQARTVGSSPVLAAAWLLQNGRLRRNIWRYWVAIKKIKLQGLKRKHLTLNEIMIMKTHRSPSVVNYLNSYLPGEELWLVMEYMDGGALSDVISKSCLSEEEMAAVSRECLRGLDFLHSNHVIHQDLKSSNILLRTDGSVKLGDFDLSTQLTPEKNRRSSLAGPA